MSGNIPLLLRWLTSVGVLPKAAVAQIDSKEAPKAQSVLDAGRLAERTYSALDALDRDVVLVARMGQNLKSFGLTYSHMGFAVRNLDGKDWGIVHLLTKNDGSQSGIYAEGLVNFFCDNPFEMACLIQTLPPSIEKYFYQYWKELANKLHNSNYSLTSYPWSLTSQNSNQWVLETLTLCVDSAIESREQAQAWLSAQGYSPSELNVALPTQWAGPLLRDSIRFTDQPEELRLQGKIQTVTVDSVLKFLNDCEYFKNSATNTKRIEIIL